MGSKGVAEIMDAHVFETCGLPDVNRPGIAGGDFV